MTVPTSAFDAMLDALKAVDHWLRESPIREIQMAEDCCGVEAPTFKVRAAIEMAEGKSVPIEPVTTKPDMRTR